jgi:hypothetical protein
VDLSGHSRTEFSPRNIPSNLNVVVDVAGIAAAIRSANPSWNPSQVRDAIVNSAVVLPSSGILLATVDDISCPRPPTSAPTPCSNGMDVEIQIKTDYYPRETSWILTNTCTGTVINSPKYTKYVTMHSTSMLCLPAGQYEFTIKDIDGLCCRYGDGSYAIVVDGITMRSGGAFRSSEVTTFGAECAGAAQGAVQSSVPPTNPPTSESPTNSPTLLSPSSQPTELPTTYPTPEPTTGQPTTESPTSHRPTTKAPTGRPTSKAPTKRPTTRIPTRNPTRKPSKSPTRKPTRFPTRAPTGKPIGK